VSKEWHIASFIVTARPERIAAVIDAVLKLPQTELAVHEGARLVLVMEGEHRGEIMDRVDALRDLEGVITVNLVYHHAEDKDALEQEMHDDRHTA
jgi:periplasmic nitrate reductase NapD